MLLVALETSISKTVMHVNVNICFRVLDNLTNLLNKKDVGKPHTWEIYLIEFFV